MSSYSGKAWEDKFKQLAEKAGCSVIRLYDTMFNYKSVDNPADFIISIDKNLPSILIECKVCQSSSFSFSKFKQLDRLLLLPQFNSYVVIWFTESKKILALEATEIGKIKDEGIKSINPNKLDKIKDIRVVDLCTVFKSINPSVLEVKRLWKKE